MSKQHTCPLIIDGEPKNQNIQRLEKVRLNLSPDKSKEKLYDEYWIQNLIHNNPSILPVEELESAFFPLYPVCRELKTPAGYLDNLFVSENGSLTLVECKLWRNPEARREVIGQALDYAKEFSNWHYEDLNKAIQETTKEEGNILYDRVSKEIAELDESRFVDSVSRNLTKGRFLILIVGDGIREGVENISNFLQKHSGLDFTFGLVELGFFKIPETDKYIVQPRIFARTYTVERAVIRAEGLKVEIETPKQKNISHAIQGRRSTISEEQFFEALSSVQKDCSNTLMALLNQLAPHDIFPVYGSSSLNLRWLPEDNLKMNFGSIYKNGVVDTSTANWVPEKIGKVSIGHKYQNQLAALIPGATVRKHDNPSHWEVHKNGKRIVLSDLFTISDEWIKIITAIQTEILHSLN